MTVAVHIPTTPASPYPPAALPVLQKTANKRWPPMANRSTLPYKLTAISKEKLAREATAPDPDLRRCVAHFRLHCGSVEWTEKDMKSRISSFEFEDDSEDEKDESDQKTEAKLATKDEFTEVKINPPGSSKPVIETVEVEVMVETLPSRPSSPPLSPKPENRLLDKSRNCLEASSKHFWPSGGACIAVPPVIG